MGSYQALNGLRQCSNVLCETSWLVEPVLWLPLPPASGGARKNMTHWGGGHVWGPSLLYPCSIHSTPTCRHPPSGTQRLEWMGCVRHKCPHPARGAGNLPDPSSPPSTPSFPPLPRAAEEQRRQWGRWQGCSSPGKASHV